MTSKATFTRTAAFASHLRFFPKRATSATCSRKSFLGNCTKSSARYLVTFDCFPETVPRGQMLFSHKCKWVDEGFVSGGKCDYKMLKEKPFEVTSILARIPPKFSWEQALSMFSLHSADHECTLKVGTARNRWTFSSYILIEVCGLAKCIKTWEKQTKAFDVYQRVTAEGSTTWHHS